MFSAANKEVLTVRIKGFFCPNLRQNVWVKGMVFELQILVWFHYYLRNYKVSTIFLLDTLMSTNVTQKV